MPIGSTHRTFCVAWKTGLSFRLPRATGVAFSYGLLRYRGMASSAFDHVSAALQALKLQNEDELTVFKHDASSNAGTWADALSKVTEKLPEPRSLTKTLVLKPKVPKSQEAGNKLVMLVALDTTPASMSATAKVLGLKEVRFAPAELVRETFGVEPEAVSPLSVSKENADKVQVVLDGKLSSASQSIGFHPAASDSTVFMSANQLHAYFESVGVEPQVVEFSGETMGKQMSKETKTTVKPKKEESRISDAVQVGITVYKDLDFSRWYQEVLLKSEMIDYYDVSGCYILRPWSFAIWEQIQKWFDAKIKEMDVENASFPMFISARQLETEKDHLEGFSPEVAWITRAGQSDLDEPIAVRPTSETAMYPYYAKWIRSHRDLPLRYNQWNSVVRWEFKNPQPFLRTREFLWQEGHCVYLTKEHCEEEVFQILDLYSQVYTDLLAVPVIKGIKSEKEKFAGGLMTTTVEGYIPTTGRGIQGGTSHALGQNFSRMFDITVENPDSKTGDPAKDKLYVWQSSWGLSTRVIGVMVMTHGDNKGLKLPPAVAQYQVVLVPCGITARTSDEDREAIEQGTERFAQLLRKGGVRAKADTRQGYTPGWKFSQWEMKGVPLRLEFGPQDRQKEQVTAVRRDTGEKSAIALDDLVASVSLLLQHIQSDMYTTAAKNMADNVVKIRNWDDFVPALNDKKLILIPWCNTTECEESIKDNSARIAMEGEAEDERAPSMGAKSLCNPLEQPSGEDKIIKGVTKCVACGGDAKLWGLFGRSY